MGAALLWLFIALLAAALAGFGLWQFGRIWLNDLSTTHMKAEASFGKLRVSLHLQRIQQGQSSRSHELPSQEQAELNDSLTTATPNGRQRPRGRRAK